jgi:hypothetical protein
MNQNEAVSYLNNTKQMGFHLLFKKMMKGNKMIFKRIIRGKEPIPLIMKRKKVLYKFQNLRVVRRDNQLPELQ